MKNTGASKKNRANDSGPSWRVVLATVIFLSWVVSSAVILYVSKTSTNTPAPKAVEGSAPPSDTTAPFSTIIQDKGKCYRQFVFPPTLAIGNIGTFSYKPLGTIHGTTVYSGLDGVRDKPQTAEGSVKFPAEDKLSFVPGEMLAVNPSSLTHFRPGDIYDITFRRVQDIDVDVYVEACSQIKGVSRLDLSSCADLTKEGVTFIDGFETLHQLNIPISRGALPVVARLAVISKVRSLGLFSNYDMYPILLGLRTSLNLKALKLQGPVISDDTLIAVTAIPLLEELSIASDLCNKPESVANALKILARAPRLKIISLETADMNQPLHLNAAGEKAMLSFKTLELLRLNNSTRLQ